MISEAKREGLLRARAKVLARDPDYYRKMGAKGGRAKVKKGFATWSKEDLKALAKRNHERRKSNGQ